METADGPEQGGGPRSQHPALRCPALRSRL